MCQNLIVFDCKIFNLINADKNELNCFKNVHVETNTIKISKSLIEWIICVDCVICANQKITEQMCKQKTID